MKKIIIFDLYNFIHRARYSFNEGPYSLIFNFFRSIKKEIKYHNPDTIFFVKEGTPIKRNELFAEYKNNRPQIDKDDIFHVHKKEIQELLLKFPVKIIQNKNFEADDVINFLIQKYNSNNEVILCSTDTDFIQCLKNNENLKIWNPVKKIFVEWDKDVDYVIYKSLKGDKTDNIPGVTGIGEKKARILASNLYDLKKFLESSEEIKQQFKKSYELVKFHSVDDIKEGIEESVGNFDSYFIKNKFKDMKFYSIINDSSWKEWNEIFSNIITEENNDGENIN